MFAKKRPPKKGPARVGGRQVRAQQRGGEGRAAFRVQSVPWVTPRWRLLSWRAGSGGWMILLSRTAIHGQATGGEGPVAFSAQISALT